MVSANADEIVITAVAAMCPQFTGKPGTGWVASANIATPWFVPERYFGASGFKYLPHSARYLLAAVKLLMDDLALGKCNYAEDDMGAIIGTNFGVLSVLEEMDDILLARGANALKPMQAPNFSVNVPASLVSIKHGFRAFNITLTSAMVCGLEAILAGHHALRVGRARLVIAGATEDMPPSHVTAALGLGIDGGACVLALERRVDVDQRGGRIHGKIGGGALRFFAPHRLQQDATGNDLYRLIDLELDCIIPQHVNEIRCFCVGTRDVFCQKVGVAIWRALEMRKVRLISSDDINDDASLTSVSPVLLAARLAIEGESGLVVACSPQGHIGLLYLEGVLVR